MGKDKVNILLVEDDDVAAEKIRGSFRKAELQCDLHHAINGIEALEILRGKGKHKQLSRPYMILLDIRMPKMDGIQFLKELRGDDDLRDSVVFVLTTSDSESDKKAAYNRQIAGYIVKSKLDKSCSRLIEMLVNYWEIVDLPMKK